MSLLFGLFVWCSVNAGIAFARRVRVAAGWSDCFPENYQFNVFRDTTYSQYELWAFSHSVSLLWKLRLREFSQTCPERKNDTTSGLITIRAVRIRFHKGSEYQQVFLCFTRNTEIGPYFTFESAHFRLPVLSVCLPALRPVPRPAAVLPAAVQRLLQEHHHHHRAALRPQQLLLRNHFLPPRGTSRPQLTPNGLRDRQHFVLDSNGSVPESSELFQSQYGHVMSHPAALRPHTQHIILYADDTRVDFYIITDQMCHWKVFVLR